MISNENKPPIINCHVHVFTGDYVPPYLAKTFVPGPVAWFISMTRLIQIIRWYNKKIKPLKYLPFFKKYRRFVYKIEIWFKRKKVIGFFKVLLDIYLFVLVTFYFGRYFMSFEKEYSNLLLKGLQWLFKTLDASGWMLEIKSVWAQIGLFILILIVFKSVRNLCLLALKQLKVMPGKDFLALFHRYLQIGEFAKYQQQSRIYKRLCKQYPIDTKFVCLPMDMKYMQAGPVKKDLGKQLDELADIKADEGDQVFPFIFAHPERMEDEAFFNYSVGDEGKVILDENCAIAQYFKKGLKGIKIYPALGYYPFDARLLPLWKYAQQENIPIMTHCIRGTIFYRGTKKKEWDAHPIFNEGRVNTKKKKVMDQDFTIQQDIDLDADYIEEVEHKKLYLNEVKNIEFCNNFTHPMNYLCLLDQGLLYQAINRDDIDEKQKKALRKMFPCDDDIKVVKGDGLKGLKICFAHFGGDDQWKRFLESDRDNYTTQLLLQPDHGIHFLTDKNGNPKPGKPALIWRYVDWYTIICSLMLQYDNVYADISYILHDEIILPLLKQTLTNSTLKERVLYGSDFYVVRNHKSDKEMLADMRAGLSEEEFDMIARENPRVFLRLNV